MENLIKIDDLEVPLFLETPISELEVSLRVHPGKNKTKDKKMKMLKMLFHLYGRKVAVLKERRC